MKRTDLRENILSYFLGFLVLLVISLPITGMFLYTYWKDIVEDNDGYNSINAVIADAGGIINIIAIFFLYINYNKQKKQIREDRKVQNLIELWMWCTSS